MVGSRTVQLAYVHDPLTAGNAVIADWFCSPVPGQNQCLYRVPIKLSQNNPSVLLSILIMLDDLLHGG